MPVIAHDLRGRLAALTTPLVADAVVHLGLPLRQAPAGISAAPEAVVVGRVLPAQYSGHLEDLVTALAVADVDDVLVIDNGGRVDEACVGDLLVHEALRAGIAGLVVWGVHRDVIQLRELPVPIFSYGTVPAGPATSRPRLTVPAREISFGDHTVTNADAVMADPNGVLFLPLDELAVITDLAESIREHEAEQLTRLRVGIPLREQLGLESGARTDVTDATSFEDLYGNGFIPMGPSDDA